MGRPKRHNEATHDALLAAAGRLLTRSGPQAVTLRALAAEIGSTTRAVYSVFGSKEGIVRALYREGFDKLDRELRSAISDDPAERIIQLGLAYRRSALAAPDLYRVMFLEPFREFTRDATDRELARRTLQYLDDAVRRAHTAGVLDSEIDHESSTIHLWAIMHGLALLELGGEFDHIAPGEEHWRIVIGSYLNGRR